MLVTLIALHAPAHHDDRPTEMCPPDVVEHFNRLDDALRHMEGDIEELRTNPHRKEHARQDLLEVMQQSQQARVAACRAARAPTTVVVEPPPPQRVVVVLSDVQEQQLAGAVRKEAFDDNRLSVLALGVSGVCVTTAQARDLVDELTFSHPRLEALRVLAPHIVDKGEGYRLLDAFTFDSDKREAKALLTSTVTAPECAPVYRM